MVSLPSLPRLTHRENLKPFSVGELSLVVPIAHFEAAGTLAARINRSTASATFLGFRRRTFSCTPRRGHREVHRYPREITPRNLAMADDRNKKSRQCCSKKMIAAGGYYRPRS
jgi:hypothetical protein